MSADRPLVVLAGPIHADGHANLETGARVVVCNDEMEAGLVAMAAQAQGILFRSKPRCTESLMAACKQLKVVGRHGVGLDTVDIPAATRLGVAVVHAPGSNSQAVAEHALMMMLVCVKKTLYQDKLTRAGDWGAKRTSANTAHTELEGKTLGIKDIGKPDWGDAPHFNPGDVPVFWACGVTPQAVALASKPSFMLTHSPGHMFITDLPNSSLAAL